MLKITVLTILLLLVFCGESTPVTKRETDRSRCGRVLAEALSVVCDGRYRGPNNDDNNTRKKRDLGSEIDVDYPRGWYFELPYPRVAVREHHFERRGVVDECCHQSCPISVLLSYCAD